MLLMKHHHARLCEGVVPAPMRSAFMYASLTECIPMLLMKHLHGCFCGGVSSHSPSQSCSLPQACSLAEKRSDPLEAARTREAQIIKACIARRGLFVGCLTSQQRAGASQRRICSDNFTCCHSEIEVADPTFYLTQSQYTDTGPASPSTDPITLGAWQGSHWSAIFQVTGMTRPRKNPVASGIRTRDFPLSRWTT